MLGRILLLLATVSSIQAGSLIEELGYPEATGHWESPPLTKKIVISTPVIHKSLINHIVPLVTQKSDIPITIGSIHGGLSGLFSNALPVASKYRINAHTDENNHDTFIKLVAPVATESNPVASFNTKADESSIIDYGIASMVGHRCLGIGSGIIGAPVINNIKSSANSQSSLLNQLASESGNSGSSELDGIKKNLKFAAYSQSAVIDHVAPGMEVVGSPDSGIIIPDFPLPDISPRTVTDYVALEKGVSSGPASSSIKYGLQPDEIPQSSVNDHVTMQKGVSSVPISAIIKYGLSHADIPHSTVIGHVSPGKRVSGASDSTRIKYGLPFAEILQSTVIDHVASGKEVSDAPVSTIIKYDLPVSDVDSENRVLGSPASSTIKYGVPLADVPQSTVIDHVAPGKRVSDAPVSTSSIKYGLPFADIPQSTIIDHVAPENSVSDSRAPTSIKYGLPLADIPQSTVFEHVAPKGVSDAPNPQNTFIDPVDTAKSVSGSSASTSIKYGLPLSEISLGAFTNYISPIIGATSLTGLVERTLTKQSVIYPQEIVVNQPSSIGTESLVPNSVITAPVLNQNAIDLSSSASTQRAVIDHVTTGPVSIGPISSAVTNQNPESDFVMYESDIGHGVSSWQILSSLLGSALGVGKWGVDAGMTKAM